MTPCARAFAPASVSNLACGFDILGFGLDTGDRHSTGLGDIVSASERDGNGGSRPQEPVRITAITGDGGKLPLEADRNTAAVAARALLDREAPDAAVDLAIEKGMPLESGLGSSAASAVAAVVAVDALLELSLPPTTLLRYALAGEILASGGAHADNLAPSLFGGLVLVRSLDPEPDVIELPVPEGLTCALARPHIQVNTLESRASLKNHLPLARAVTQWGNAAALVASLYRGDLDLLSRSLVDVVAEPVRAPGIPGFFAAKEAALEAGALGCSLSGSGPALFALCRSEGDGKRAAAAMAAALEDATGRACDQWISQLPAPGARLLQGGSADDAGA